MESILIKVHFDNMTPYKNAARRELRSRMRCPKIGLIACNVAY